MTKQIYDPYDLKYGRKYATVYVEFKSFINPVYDYKGKAKVVNTNADNITVRPLSRPAHFITMDYDECEDVKVAKTSNTNEEITIFKLK